MAGYPDVPDDDDDDFAVVHLDRLPTHLVVSPGHPLTRLGDAITLEESINSRRWPCPMAPSRNARRRSRD
ncbi:hypothetical protein [Synechococcus sp. LTW-R]|uniref:hypothetical protein n=1 Tax=Synechococcus sp. LTW-R TaxID=2751170 RepID=UPI00351BE229